MADLRAAGSEVRRRMGAASSHLGMAAPPPPPPDPYTLIQGAYAQGGGMLSANDWQSVRSQIGAIHDPKLVDDIHRELLTAGIVKRSRARTTTYHWQGG